MGIPLKRPTDDLKDNVIKKHIQHLSEEALGNIISLSAAPSATVPLLEDNSIGKYGNNVYIRIGNVIYTIATDAQTTIT